MDEETRVYFWKKKKRKLTKSLRNKRAFPSYVGKLKTFYGDKYHLKHTTTELTCKP